MTESESIAWIQGSAYDPSLYLSLTIMSRQSSSVRRFGIAFFAVCIFTSGFSHFPVSTPVSAAGSCNGLSVTLAGTPGNDTLIGTVGPDVIDGMGGNDTVLGMGGNDTICTGSGNDNITTTSGNDWINAGDGTNSIDAGGGNNTVTTGGGNDNIQTGSGNDSVLTGGGNDTINVSGGNNIVNGESGDDAITAGSGNDTVDGGPGTDHCSVDGGINSTQNCETGDGANSSSSSAGASSSANSSSGGSASSSGSSEAANSSSGSSENSSSASPSVGCIEITKKTYDAQGASLTNIESFTFILDGNPSLTETNDGTGLATFQNVAAPGVHTVTENAMSGWNPLSVTPADGNVMVSAGTPCATMVFENQQVGGSSSSSVSSTSSSSESSSTAGGGGGGTAGGGGGALTASIAGVDGSTGAHRGGDTNRIIPAIALVAKFYGAGIVPQAAFGGTGNRPLSSEGMRLLCSAQRAMGLKARSSVVDIVADILSGVTGWGMPFLGEQLVSTALCEGIALFLSPEPTVITHAPRPIPLLADGYPDFGDDLENLCARKNGQLSIQQ
ncbi:MAG: hemolysin-type calcium-binding protein, partial [Gammaproteobacteria bacterium]